MAEARDPLTPHDPAPAESGTYAARGKAPIEIERDIDHTRAEMSETLDAIGARFQPDYIKEQAKDALRSTAHDAGATMIDTLKENPVPAIIAGLSVGWLIMKGGESERDRYHRERYEDDHYRRYGRYPARSYAPARPYTRGYDRYEYETYRTGSSGYDGGEQSLKDRAGDAADQARSKAHEVQQKAGDLADRAADQAHDLADDARYYGRRAENWLERQMNESPLTMGAVALAAGALVGLAVPETRKENELMGRPSDRLKEQAKDAAEEKLDQAKRVAEATAEEAKDKAKDVAETAKEEAKKQDLDEPPKTMQSDFSKSGSSKSGSSS